MLVGGRAASGVRAWDDFLGRQFSFYFADRGRPGDGDLHLGNNGSTEGVVLTHGNLVTATHNAVTTFQYTADDRVLNFFPMFHINGGVTTLFPALTTGGSRGGSGRNLAIVRIWT